MSPAVHPARPRRRAAAVVFDVDGTLADTEALSAAAWDHVLRPHGISRTQADDSAVTGLSFTRTRDHFARRAPGLPSADQLWPRYSTRLLALLADDVQPYPDALALLIGLHRRRVPVALATSSPRARLSATLTAMGLGDLESVAVAGDEVDTAKPAPDVFLAAAALIGTPAHACVAIEDSAPGVRAALAAGMQVVGVRRQPWACLGEATTVVDRLDLGVLDDYLVRRLR